jgi:acyl-CoA synthetase (AMP-forming)/AMP-acid ligase II
MARVWTKRQDPGRAARMRAVGAWRNETIGDYARALAARDPERTLIIESDRRLTAAALLAEAEVLARSLIERGLRPGSVVSYMLPNWHESCAISLAAALAGLVLNPLLPIYRTHEIKFMLADSQSQLIFIPAIFRNFDYREMLASLRHELPHLREVVVVRGAAREFTGYEQFTVARSFTALPLVEADSVKMLIYTSGTTGRPKGVLHSHNTILADVRSLAEFWAVSEADRFFVPSPVTHIGGSLYAHEFVWYSAAPAVLLDVWEAREAMRLINEFSCTLSAGATPFLRDLVDAACRSGEMLPSLRLYVCGGASVPPALIRLAQKTFRNCVVCRVYGSTEVPTITAGARPSDDLELRAETDGEVYGTEVRIVHPDTGVPLGRGAVGELVARGPEMFLGYAEQADNVDAFTSDGFFKTGDLGYWGDDSHLVITGRKKDLIIRAGENISAKEIEDLLEDHPAIAEVAVVAVPSARTGEAVCACIVLSNGESISLVDIARFLLERDTSRQKFPEAMLLLESLPRTATGKIRKDELRIHARQKAIWSDRNQ